VGWGDSDGDSQHPFFNDESIFRDAFIGAILILLATWGIPFGPAIGGTYVGYSERYGRFKSALYGGFVGVMGAAVLLWAVVRGGIGFFLTAASASGVRELSPRFLLPGSSTSSAVPPSAA